MENLTNSGIALITVIAALSQLAAFHEPTREVQSTQSERTGARSEGQSAAPGDEWGDVTNVSQDEGASMMPALVVDGASSVHLAWMGYPVVGDTVYGYRRQRILQGRHFLHAAGISFVHPITGAQVQFEAPLPAELQRVIDHLRPA